MLYIQWFTEGEEEEEDEDEGVDEGDETGEQTTRRWDIWNHCTIWKQAWLERSLYGPLQSECFCVNQKSRWPSYLQNVCCLCGSES